MDEAEEEAKKRLRYITLDKLTKEDLEVSPTQNTPGFFKLLFGRSSPGSFGEIDAFISHSWQDPVDEKWDALQAWRDRFKARHGREPRVWFDKFCIDQGDVDASLTCLPVHLAACNTFLMLVGPTYTERVWCVMEIFIFMTAVKDTSRIECIPLLASQEPQSQTPTEGVFAMFRAFSHANCKCYSVGMRDKLLTIIEAGCGTLDDFDAYVRALDISCLELPTTTEVRRFSTMMKSSSVVPE